ncbi:hypothetical protein [Sediminibacterium sp.]|uniref:hypothetical protein n=1 Tax=Sediminibacterium sp. TaxID=1917865 RepID=UPI003F6FEBA5
MTAELILPISPESSHEAYLKADKEYAEFVNKWINSKIEIVQEIFSTSFFEPTKNSCTNPEVLAIKITNILTQRVFNFQSKKNLSSLIPKVCQNLVSQILKGTPIQFFLLYNGGYRASSFPDKLSLIFEPDQTELMLLYQIALLNKKISLIYEPGIEFFIVVNNGVAHWVNDIPLGSTENYANHFRRIIELVGAEGTIRLLLQSELAGFNPTFSFEPIKFYPLLSEKEHGIVERFLGRTCTSEEAIHRASLYTIAEEQWGRHLTSIVQNHEAILLRQVAHPEMLSFRPFPGGAIRTQNGSFGFQQLKNTLRPKLITSESVKQYGLKYVLYHFPWAFNNKFVNTVELTNE